MKFYYRQQSKGSLYLCVCEKYKNDFYLELKNKINTQIPFLSKNGVEEIDLQQSNISESCYIKVFLKGYKHPSYIRISGHYGNDENEIIIENTKYIKSMFHFNKASLHLIKKEIIEIEKDLRNKKRF